MINGGGDPDYAVATAMAETDDEHIAYMLDGGTRGMIERLVETEDTWGFGGSLWISKTYAHYEAGALGASSGRIYYKALAAPDLGPLMRLLDRVANHLRDPASRAPDANLAVIVEEDAEWS